eukprot:7302554-Lingulodinium_polyedra.AAC.1
MAGLRGLGGEEGILATALNRHFKQFGPEHWHFKKKRSKSDHSVVKQRVVIKELVRRQALPAWVDNLLYDLRRTHQIKIATNLGLTGLAVSGSKLVPASGGISAARRSGLAEALNRQTPEELPQSFWQKFGLANALPLHLRPGKGFR